MSSPVYDQIGERYTLTRAADPRIVDGLIEALGLPAGSRVLDVGGGTGNYARALAERGFQVTVVEPSQTMRQQAAAHPGVTWVEGAAEELPLESDSHDAAVIVLAAHHFADLRRALVEVNRVCGKGPTVLFTYDPGRDPGFWLFHYFPGFLDQARVVFPSLELLQGLSSRRMEIRRFPLPPDLADQFAAAGWARPEAYLDAGYRAGISSFRLADANEVERGLGKLGEDLESGAWDLHFGEYRQRREYDAGYVFLRLG